jgi:hypothetical protein
MGDRRSLVIDRNRWCRGSLETSLLRHDGRQCCLGIYLSDLGVEDDRLEDRYIPAHLQEALPAEAAWTLGPNNGQSRIAVDLVHTNDDVALDEALRERRIAKLFGDVGIDVTFVDGPGPRTAGQVTEGHSK